MNDLDSIIRQQMIGIFRALGSQQKGLKRQARKIKRLKEKLAEPKMPSIKIGRYQITQGNIKGIFILESDGASVPIREDDLADAIGRMLYERDEQY